MTSSLQNVHEICILMISSLEVTILNSSTDLYNCFICYTICHHLTKYHISLPDNFVDLNSLAIEECCYWQVIIQLSFLSYQALDKNYSTFTLDEIKTACPQIDEVSEVLNGFGLFQAMQHFGIKKTITMNFAYLSLQEFLAAYYNSWLYLIMTSFVYFRIIWS